MNEDRINEMLNAVSRLSPKTLTIVIKEDGSELVNSRLPFSLVRTVLKYAKNFSSIASAYAPGMRESELKDLLRAVDIDAILADLSSGSAILPYTLADIKDSNGRHAYAMLE